MKKAIYIGIIALCALVMFSCDDFTSSAELANNEPVLFAPDGVTPLVNLAIRVGGGHNRALTQELARGNIDFYEVAFLADDVVYRTSWNYTQVGRIAIPFGDYKFVDPALDNPDPASDGSAPGDFVAILFAGRQSDRTLLAVGNLTSTAVGGAPGTTLVGPNTTVITFTLSALTNDINVTPTTTTFGILEPDDNDPIDYRTREITGNIPTALVNSRTIPVYKVPINNDEIKAYYGVKVPHYQGVVFAEANSDIISAGIAIDDDGGATVEGEVIHGLGDSVGDWNVSDPSTGFQIEIDTTNVPQAGISRLSVAVPVNAINNDNEPGKWFIRGGLSNHIFDAGITGGVGGVASLGGAVLLAVGPVNIAGLEIDTTGPSP